MPVRIQTERLTLRFTEVDDADPLAAIWADPRVMRFMGEPRDHAEVAGIVRDEALAGVTERVATWSIVERGSGTVIGDIGLQRKEIDGRDEVEIIYLMAFEHWGRGYCTEAAEAVRDHAFGALGLQRLTALINPENAASERVARKIGMRREKTIQRAKGPRQLYVAESAART